jgi:hypothetical protein
MKRFLHNLFGKKSGKAAKARTRRSSLGIESLEDRNLMSISPLALTVSSQSLLSSAIISQSANTQTDPVHYLSAASMSATSVIENLLMKDLTNVQFNLHLVNGAGSDTSTLLIQSQTDSWDGTATFTGLWTNSSGSYNVSGLLAHDAAGKITLDTYWTGPDFVQNHLSATISPWGHSYNVVAHVDYSSAIGIAYSGSYDLVSDMPSLKGAFFDLKSSNNKPDHDLYIETQTDTPSGAVITGRWIGLGPNSTNNTGGDPSTEGNPIDNGLLYLDSEANVRIYFSWNSKNELQNGTITYVPAGSTPAHYHLTGHVGALPSNPNKDGGPGDVSGDSAIPQPIWLSPYVRFDMLLAQGVTGLPAAAAVSDLTNVSLTMVSDDGTVSHQLVIQSQAAQADGSATFSGMLDPANGGQAVTGTLADDAQGNIHLTFLAADGSSFDSTVTGAAGAYHVDGILTPGDGSAPIHLAGDQDQPPPAPAPAPAVTPVADLTNVSFTVISDDGSVSHQLVIQSQAAQADGSATFSGMLDPANGGQSVSGTLAYDDQGNIHLTFIAADGSSLDGTVSGAAATYHLDGILNPADGSAPIHLAGDQDQPPPAPAPAPAVTPVADLTNVSFTVLSDDGSVSHQLVIQSQVAQADGSATFSGMLDPANGGQSVSGTLAYDAQGNIHLTFIAADGSSFDSTVSGAAGAYHLDGILNPADGSVPIHLAGDQDQPPPAPAPAPAVTPVADLTSVSFTVLSDDGSVSHQLVIQSQVAQADGSATISGVWDPANADGGQAVTGTLAYDVAGNIHLTFVAADGSSFDATISGAAGAYNLDGILTPADGSGPVHLAGAQG